MIIRVSDIQAEGVNLDDVSACGAPFADPAWRLTGIHLHLDREDADVLVTGAIEATVPQVCSRCLETYPVDVRADVDLRFVPRPAGGDRELTADDLELDFYDHDELDLDALIETETTLALPMKSLCRPDCRGLCPMCGSNRNLAPCACPERPPDPRLAALREVASRLQH